MVFMMLSGVSFALYFVACATARCVCCGPTRSCAAYFGVVFGSVVLVSVYLAAHGKHASYLESLRHAAFHVISVATTGGYAISDYGQWPPFAPVLMIGLGCFATCAGSTGGGIKMIACCCCSSSLKRELVRIVHPQVVNPVVLGRRRWCRRRCCRACSPT
jgi:trk system potassium uptake protein TrkH